MIAFFFNATVQYLQLTFAAILIILGFVNFYDIVVGDDFPPIENMYNSNLSITENIDGPDLSKRFDPEQAWASLQSALQILDVVCPEASKWAREQHDTKKIVWDLDPDDGAYASFNPYTKSITINVEMLDLKNGERACTIAHEFRHSRQNISKFIKSACFFLITGTRNPDIVENDAYLYESQVRSAIYGR